MSSVNDSEKMSGDTNSDATSHTTCHVSLQKIMKTIISELETTTDSIQNILERYDDYSKYNTYDLLEGRYRMLYLQFSNAFQEIERLKNIMLECTISHAENFEMYVPDTIEIFSNSLQERIQDEFY